MNSLDGPTLAILWPPLEFYGQIIGGKSRNVPLTDAGAYYYKVATYYYKALARGGRHVTYRIWQLPVFAIVGEVGP